MSSLSLHDAKSGFTKNPNCHQSAPKINTRKSIVIPHGGAGHVSQLCVTSKNLKPRAKKQPPKQILVQKHTHTAVTTRRRSLSQWVPRAMSFPRSTSAARDLAAPNIDSQHLPQQQRSSSFRNGGTHRPLRSGTHECNCHAPSELSFIDLFSFRWVANDAFFALFNGDCFGEVKPRHRHRHC